MPTKLKGHWTTYKAEYEEATRTLATARAALVQASRECLEKDVEIERLRTALARNHNDLIGHFCSTCARF